ncbi:twin-arginine translocation signal domain-containing protein [Halodurantibacterium flavum]|uniref:Twin-arginine translocation signal domain-containing protein n=1 Tax=Halodurantibacterium flavum TaxID=1382802 RepID=A0ABW4S6C6_9RHOB
MSEAHEPNPAAEPASRDADRTAEPGRRRFLKLGLGVTGAAAAGGAAVLAQDVVLQEDERGKARYQGGPHVERFYALNRL